MIAERLPAAVGPVEAMGDSTCAVNSGAESIDNLALWLGMLGADFELTDCPELVGHLRMLAARYLRAAGG